MSLRLDVIDSFGNEHEGKDWFREWPQEYFAAVISDRDFATIMEKYLGINLEPLKLMEPQEGEWQDIGGLMECIELLLKLLKESEDEEATYISMNWERIRMGLQLWGEAFEEPYFLEGGFHQHLEDLLRMLRHMKTTGARQIRLSVSGY